MAKKTRKPASLSAATAADSAPPRRGRKAKTPRTPPTTPERLGSVIKSCRKIMRKDKGLNGDLDRLPLLTWIRFLKFLDDLELQRAEEARLAEKQRSDTSPETLTPSLSPIQWARVASDSPCSRRRGRRL